jgi:uncharacterized membrane protein (DUF4010 family)
LIFSNKEKKKKETKLDIDDKSPFEILPALKFALVFTLILFLIHFVKERIGENAVYITTFFVSLVDTETIILPAIESQKNEHFSVDLVSNVIAIAIIINTLIKLLYI